MELMSMFMNVVPEAHVLAFRLVHTKVRYAKRESCRGSHLTNVM